MSSPKIIVKQFVSGATIGAGTTDSFLAGGLPAGVFCSFSVELSTQGTVRITNISMNDGTSSGTGPGFIISNTGSADITYNINGIVAGNTGTDFDLSSIQLTKTN